MVYIITWSVVLLASASAVAALSWALRTGQLRRLEEGARAPLIDDDGSVEQPDYFPDLANRRRG